MATITGSLQGIIDIEPPLAPPAGDGEFVVSVVVFLVFCSIVVYIFWQRYYSRRGRARRELSLLRRRMCNPQDDTITSQHVAFQIAHILRQGLNIKSISYSTHLPFSMASLEIRWQQFCDKLSQARYAPGEHNREQLARLFDDAEYWIRKWPQI